MADLLIHDLDIETVRRLEQMARDHGTTPDGEAKRLLEAVVSAREPAAAVLAEAIRASFGGRVFDDSAILIREDRER